MIKFTNVEHIYGEGREGQKTFTGLSLIFNPGEFVVVVGPNGSGKSTLLKLIRGIEKPKSGEVVVYGVSTDSQEFDKFALEKIGYLLENPKMQIVASLVNEDILFSLENLGFEADDARMRLQEVAEELGISHLLNRSVETLSDGEIQRVALAGVLVVQPEIILSDESTAWLDPASAFQVMEIFKKLAGSGKTVIHVTHEPMEMVLADKILILDKGKVIAFDRPDVALKNGLALHRLGIPVPLPALISDFLKNEGVNLDRVFLYPEEIARWLS